MSFDGGTLPRRSNSTLGVHGHSALTRKASTANANLSPTTTEAMFKLNEEEIRQLLWSMKDLKKGVPLRDYKKGFKTYKKCFLGKELCEWLLTNGHAITKDEAESMCNELYVRRAFKTYRPKNNHSFSADYFYQFGEEEIRSSLDAPREMTTHYRFCAMGQEGTGKASFCRRWSEDTFSSDAAHGGTSISAALTLSDESEKSYKKSGMRYNSHMGLVSVELLNTAAVDGTMEARLAKYIEWSAGFLLFFSRNEHSSFEVVSTLYNSIVKIREFRATPIVVVATGSDREESERQVTKEEIGNLQSTYRCQVIEVSSVTGTNVNEAIEHLVESARRVKILNGATAQRRGWIRIKTKKGTKKRYAVLTQTGLRYYAAEPSSHNDTSNMRGIIPLHQCGLQLTSYNNMNRWHSDPNIHKSTNNGTSSPSNGTITPNTLNRLALSGFASGHSTSTSVSANNSTTGLSNSINSAPNTGSLERRMSDSSGESFDSGVATPRGRNLSRIDNLSATGGFTLKGDRHKIYLMDKGENEYELGFSSTEERDEWYEELSQAIERANYGDKRDRRSESSASPEYEAASRPSISTTDSSSTIMKSNLADIRAMNKLELRDHVITLFNQNPKKGVALLRECGLIEDKPINVALFFNENQAALRKAAIGEYLGDKGDYNQEVLVEHLKRLDLTGHELDEGIRLFLAFFTLAGEGQQVGRVMEKFAERYFECNPTAFASSDEALILAFALIMLNTDSHSTTVRSSSKMTRSKFLDNTLNCLRGTDSHVTKEYLSKMYDSITQREIAMEYDRQEFKHWDKQGYLHVRENKNSRGGTVTKKTGTKLFCILEGYCLYTFKNPVEKKPLHIVPLGNLQVQSLDKTSDGYGFVLQSSDPKGSVKSASEGKEVLLKELLFLTDDSRSQSEWLMAFNVNLISAPSYTR
ncbi:hypothetical protein PROFUN_06969 [Planoprotostelium fungivorum]|uniref:Uncharacterized protein n=1 Tax=Planoprotostelium fungivorum TaxID=1890364 RepID=A0A2P6NN78_9EUKA|nr:hypothetical protein PROFUN_06969 [Planoprotostelium fungivorum]